MNQTLSKYLKLAGKFIKVIVIVVLVAAVAVALLVQRSCRSDQPEPGTVADEARRAGRAPSSFPAADEDYFHDMDCCFTLTPEEVKGRNTWIVWTGGNDRLWDKLTVASIGALDFLKTLSS